MRLLSSCSASALVGLLVVACGTATTAPERAGGLTLALDQADYFLPPSGAVDVHLALMNKGSTPIFFQGCHGPIPAIAERAIAAGAPWVNAVEFDLTCQDVRASARVDPDRQFFTTFSLREPGLYRLRLFYGKSAAAPSDRQALTKEFGIY